MKKSFCRVRKKRGKRKESLALAGSTKERLILKAAVKLLTIDHCGYLLSKIASETLFDR